MLIFFILVLLLDVSDQRCSYVIFVNIRDVRVHILYLVVYMQKNSKMVCSVKGLASWNDEPVSKRDQSSPISAAHVFRDVIERAPCLDMDDEICWICVCLINLPSLIRLLSLRKVLFSFGLWGGGSFVKFVFFSCLDAIHINIPLLC